MPQIADRLKSQREALGLSQQALAERCGISARSQRNYESGERVPDADYLNAVAAAGGDVLYVVTGVRSEAHARLASVRTAAEMAKKLGGTPEQMAKTQEAIFMQLMSAEKATNQSLLLTAPEQLLLDEYRKMSLDEQTALLRQVMTRGQAQPTAGAEAVTAVVSKSIFGFSSAKGRSKGK